MRVLHISTPASQKVFKSLEEAIRVMNALTIAVQRLAESRDYRHFRFEIVVSNKSPKTGKPTNIHLHIAVCGYEYVSSVANFVCNYLSSRYASVKDDSKQLRVYKKVHDNYLYLQDYMRKQKVHQRAYERDFDFPIDLSSNTKDELITVDTLTKHDIPEEDDYEKCIFIEKMQVMLNQLKRECSMYQCVHQNEIIEEPALLNPMDVEEIIEAYQNGGEVLAVYKNMKHDSSEMSIISDNFDDESIVNDSIKCNNIECSSIENYEIPSEFESDDSVVNDMNALTTTEIDDVCKLIERMPELLKMISTYKKIRNYFGALFDCSEFIGCDKEPSS